MGKFSVIFDMDGTLLDNQGSFNDSWDLAGEKQNIQNVGMHQPEVLGMNEAGWKGYLRDHFPTLDIERFVKDVDEYRKIHRKIALHKGARQLLEFLKSNGITMAIASGTNTEKVTQYLKMLDVYKFFDAIIGGDQIVNCKPAPDVFLTAAKAIGADPEDCFVVEDANNGIRAGYAAGMRCIGVPDIADFRADVKLLLYAQINDLTEAIPIFERVLSNEA